MNTSTTLDKSRKSYPPLRLDEITTHIIELTDSKLVEAVRSAPPSRPQDSQSRVVVVILTAVVDGIPVQISNPGFQIWESGREAWEQLQWSRWIGWSGPLAAAPEHVRDEYTADGQTLLWSLTRETIPLV